MKKFQLNKQKLNLKTLTTPLLALSLMVGCAGLFSGSVGAASVTNSLNFPYIYSPSGTAESSISRSGGNITQQGSPFTLENAYNLPFYQIETASIANPCITSPIDITVNVAFTSLASDGSVDSDIFVMLTESPVSNSPTGIAVSPPYSYEPIPSNQLISISANSIVNQNLYISIWANGIESSKIGQSLLTVNSATYTLTYPDNMPDCTYPATNTPPTITSPSAVTIPSTTTSGSTVVPGSSLAATDTDGDTLSYSITAGNANSYFAIDSNTGNITTTQTNIPAGTYTITVQVDDGNGGTATADVTITVTASTTPALYCPSPYSTTTLLTPSGDCDEDGITNQTEGFDPDMDSNPSTGTAPIDTDGDSIPDYLDLDSDNDGILDTEEKGTLANSSTNPSDVDSDGTPDFRDLDSDNDSTKDVLESGRNNLDTNNDGRIDGTTNTYGIPSSAASTTNPKTLASTSLKDSDNNGTPDYRQSSRNAVSVLAKTGESTITALALATLSLVGAVLAKARRARV